MLNKGVISDAVEERCCNIQFSCDHKGGKGKSEEDVDTQTLSVC